MGLFDRLFGRGEGEKPRDDSEVDSDKSSVSRDLAKKGVNVEHRGDIITTHYPLDEGSARIVAEVLKEHLESDSQNIREIQEEVADALDLDEGLIERIVRTEYVSISVLDRISGYQDRPGSQDYLFDWVGPDDSRTSPICEEVKIEIQDAGGGVSLTDLQELLQQKASKYEEEGGTPERMGHWVPHEMCRHSIVRRVE